MQDPGGQKFKCQELMSSGFRENQAEPSSCRGSEDVRSLGRRKPSLLAQRRRGLSGPTSSAEPGSLALNQPAKKLFKVSHLSRFLWKSLPSRRGPVYSSQRMFCTWVLSGLARMA